MAAKKLEHPALDHLAATPDIFRALLTGVSDRAGVLETHARPLLDSRASGASVARRGALFPHSMSMKCWRPRIRKSNLTIRTRTMRKAHIRIAMRKNRWRTGKNSAKITSSFCAGSSRGSCRVPARHPVLGEFTLANLLNEWALHDLGHVRQLAELVRAQLYYPEIGPFQEQYALRP